MASSAVHPISELKKLVKVQSHSIAHTAWIMCRLSRMHCPSLTIVPPGLKPNTADLGYFMLLCCLFIDAI
jgi:hypothetical protein